jgi:hypothetical protein
MSTTSAALAAGTLTGWPRLAARTLWAALTALMLARFLSATATRLAGPLTICAEGCGLTPEGQALWAALGLPVFWQVLLDNLPSFILTAVHVATAILIAWRRPDNWVALLASLTLTGIGAILSAGVLTGAGMPGWVSSLLFELLTAAFSLLILVFPDGRLYPRGWAWAWAVSVGLALGPLLAALAALAGEPGLAAARVALLFGVVAAGLVMQVHRYRRVADPAERQQIKWAGFGLAGPALSWLMWFVLTWQPDGTLVPLPGGSLRVALFILLPMVWPLSLVAAILRYRLWSIDVILRRTLIYSGLTGLLGLLYFATVVALEGAVALLSGEASETRPAGVTALTTLALAAAFRPLRAWVQRGIDRAFYRRRYDAARTAAAFGAALRAGASADLDTLQAHLRAVVQETMAPEHVQLWLVRRQV